MHCMKNMKCFETCFDELLTHCKNELNCSQIEALKPLKPINSLQLYKAEHPWL